MGKQKVVKKIAIGAAVAGVAGYVAGILTAPTSGKKTRKELKKTAETSYNDLEGQLKTLLNELGDLVDDAHDRGDKLSGQAAKKFSETLKEAKTNKDKLKLVLSAMHEGEADDEDLARALKDAMKAVDHLKNFLKK